MPSNQKRDEIVITIFSYQELRETLLADISQQRGNWVITANVDILRILGQHKNNSLSRFAFHNALITADGMPITWLCKISGIRRIERVTGADLLFKIPEWLVDTEIPIVLAGGNEGQAVVSAELLSEKFRNSRFVPIPIEMAAQPKSPELLSFLATHPNSVVFVGLGAPKQEYLIKELSKRFPSAVFIGCGAAFAFASGASPRAPIWIQKAGLEWMHRLLRDPARLFIRYVLKDLPFLLIFSFPFILRQKAAIARQGIHNK